MCLGPDGKQAYAGRGGFYILLRDLNCRVGLSRVKKHVESELQHGLCRKQNPLTPPHYMIKPVVATMSIIL